MTVAELVTWLEQNADPDLPVVIAYDGRFAGSDLTPDAVSIGTTHDIYPGSRGYLKPAVPCVLLDA